MVLRKAVLLLAVLFCTAVVAASAEVIQQEQIRIVFQGGITPTSLPREGAAPVEVAVDGTFASTAGGVPPQLRRVELEINRNGHLDPTGLPVCGIAQIQPATTQGALRACRGSLVGTGSFSAKVLIPEQSPYPSGGAIYAFSGSYHGRPAILAHIYGTEPIPTSVTIPFLVGRSKGRFGTKLTALLPRATAGWGYVTSLKIDLHRRFSYRGRSRSYASASCPAPDGFSGAVFPFAHARFAFTGGKEIESTLVRRCTVSR